MKRIVAIVLTLGLLTGCAPKKQAMTGEDLMEDIKPNTVAFAEEGAPTAAVTDFAVRLLRESAQKGKNTLVSPLSVLYALSMTANGADANTLAQMESVLGEPVGVLNSFLGSYQAGEELSAEELLEKTVNLGLQNHTFIKALVENGRHDLLFQYTEKSFRQLDARKQIFPAGMDQKEKNYVIAHLSMGMVASQITWARNGQKETAKDIIRYLKQYAHLVLSVLEE